MPAIHRNPDAPARSLTSHPVEGRPPTSAEAKRRERSGHRAKSTGHIDPVWTEIRNGLPEFRPYTYRGTGHDIYGPEEET